MLRKLSPYLAIYLLLCALMAVNQRSFIYLPFAGPTEPAAAGLKEFVRKEIQAPDGAPIIYWESIGDAEEPTLLYFHGNGGGLHQFPTYLDKINHLGFHVVAMEYRGYPGAPEGQSETVIVSDAVALFDHLQTQRAGMSPAPILWGFSLGSGVATQAAAKRTPRALVLEAPFTSIPDRAQEMLPLFPARWMVVDRYCSRCVIDQVNAPIIILHGDKDLIIPIHHGQQLFDAATEPKTFNRYAGFGHLNLHTSPAYSDAARYILAH